jgi:hypothetical protein|nr:MAG TPA: TRAF PROTEIN, TRAO PROTEIN, TRAN ADHESION, BACTERIAL SECRETION.5A [Caudoviricetes sp.]
MKKLILAALILGLCSCSASRKVSLSTETKITDNTEANVTQKRDKDSTGRTEVHTEETSTRTTNKEVVTEKFDTDKPVDPATGTPPLKERTTIRERQGSARQTQAITKTEANIHESDSITDRSKYDIAELNKTITTEKTKKSVPWWVWLVGIGGVTGIVIVCRKYLKKIL